MTLLGSVRSAKYSAAIAVARREYEAARTEGARREWQLDALNRIWPTITSTVPYYRDLRDRAAVPDRFESMEEFSARVPVTSRAEVKRHIQVMTSPLPRPDFTRMTGGSTAEPVQMPAWRSENAFTRPDIWLGRSWYGVDPSSRLFLLWGHTHLLGTGMKGRLRRYRVHVRDRLVGYRRFSAYDLRPELMRKAAREILAFRPEYVIGYSVALDLFAKSNGSLRADLRDLRLKVVVGTSESFPFPDSAARMEDLFGCPVAMEYGAVETGLIAHTKPSGVYTVFWRTYMVEAVPSGAGHRLLVTSLYPRCFPLVRYDMGDEIVASDGLLPLAPGLASFDRVIGRCNDYVLLDGSVIHSEVFTHAVRPCAEISAYQVVQDGAVVRLLYVADSELRTSRVEEIRDRLTRAHPGLAGASIERAAALERTPAGKTPMVVRRAAKPRAPASTTERS